jgi:KaiC/GvpD/RAD55 family RecA-like ATPase
MLARAAGTPLDDPYEPDDLWDALPVRQPKPRRPVTGGHYPELLTYCLERGFTMQTLDAWRVSTCGPKALRWPLFAWIGDGWKTINARIRRVIDRETEQTADWFEVKGGPKTAIGNHLLGREPDAWKIKRPSWAREWIDKDKQPAKPTPEMPAFLNSVSRIMITEGQWDAMTAWQLGIPALSLPNGAQAVHLQHLLRFIPDHCEVMLALDMDKAGQKAIEHFYALLGTNVKRLFLPHKDLNEWLKADPSLTADAVLDATKPQGTTKRLSLAEIEATQIVRAEIIMPAPWSLLTARLDGGFRSSQVTSLLAPSGVGKTTVANEFIAHAALSSVKTGVIQLEGDRGEIISNLKSQVFGRAAGLHIDADDAAQRLRHIIVSSLEGKAVSVQQTVDDVKELAAEGCRFIVVDNWDYLTGDTETGQRDKARAFAAVQMIAKHYRCHVLAVWQPRKVDRNKHVNSGEQKGLSTCLQDSDIYMTLNKHGLLRLLEVEKARVKEEENISSKIWLKYDTVLNCMNQIDSPAELRLLGDNKTP